MAIYGSSGVEGGGAEKPEPPVKPKEELIRQLEEALVVTETFLQDELNFNLQELIKADGLHKLAALEKAVNAVYTNDKTKRKFQILAREVFKKYKALQPDKVLNQYAPRKNAIDVIYTAIEDNIKSADVVDIMKKIRSILVTHYVNRIPFSKPISLQVFWKIDSKNLGNTFAVFPKPTNPNDRQ